MNVKNAVSQILVDYPEARDNDNLVVFYYLREHLRWPLRETHKTELLMGYSIESLMRARRVVQNDEGSYRATADVQTRRLVRAERVKKSRDILMEEKATPKTWRF